MSQLYSEFLVYPIDRAQRLVDQVHWTEFSQSPQLGLGFFEKLVSPVDQTTGRLIRYTYLQQNLDFWDFTPLIQLHPIHHQSHPFTTETYKNSKTLL